MYEAIFENAPLGILLVAPSGLIRVANPAAESIFGYAPGELEGVPIDALVPARYAKEHAAHRERYFPTRGTRKMGRDREILALRKDGVEFPVDVGLFPSPRGPEVFATIIDVTERERARRALFESQEINRAGTWSYDLVTDEVMWSPELFRILNVTPAAKAPAYETHHRFFTPESWSRLEPAVARAVEQGTPYELVLELSEADEEGPRIAVARCEPQRDQHGTIVRLVGSFQDVTELVRTQRQRNRLLDRLSVAQDAAGVGIWEWDPESDELIWDAKMYEIYGIEPRPVTYRDWSDAVHPEDLAAAEQQLRAVASGEGRFHQEFRICLPDGVRHVLAAASIVRDQGRGGARIIGVNVDVTESARFRETLRQRDAHLALVMHSLPDAVFTVRMPERRIAFVNDEVENILGYTPQEVIGNTTRMFYTDARSFASFGARLSASIRRGESRFRTEEVLRHKDGTDLHCEITVTFKKVATKLVGVISTIRSIEDRWRAEEVLRERQEQWDRFSAATSNVLWNWNLADDTVERNVSLQAVFGYAARDVRPTAEWWIERLHPQDRVKVLGAFEAALEGREETFSYTYRFRRRDGSYATVRDRVYFLRDQDGRAYRALGAMSDITEQVRREEQVMRANNLESLGLLAGGIAHDFNNQLTSVLARAEMAELRADDPAEVRKLAQQIIRAVERASGLTRQLLTFSKGGTPERRAVSLEELVREHVTFSLRGSSTEVVFRFERPLWSADVDPGQIGQVIQNLVLNANQAMGKGGELVIETRNVALADGHGSARDGRLLELTVTDNGPGIPKDILRRIFDPYFTTKPEGHGLGLSICHSIVERHGGSITVKSALGEGTTFTIRLPATDAPRRATGPETRLRSGSGRVLVVDDLEDVRLSLTQLLEALSYRVTAVRDVEEAVAATRAAIAAGAPYDVVLTDLTIPGTAGGTEVLRRVKELAPGVRVVVVSGYTDDPVLARHKAHGFDANLSKPVRMRALSSTLARLLD